MVVIDEDVAHDLQHPALEVDVVDELIIVVQHAQRRVLGQVLSIGLVLGEATCEVLHIVLHPDEVLLYLEYVHSATFLFAVQAASQGTAGAYSFFTKIRLLRCPTTCLLNGIIEPVYT